MEIRMEYSVTPTYHAKMYGKMCSKLMQIAQKMIEIYPALEDAQPVRSGMQALCGFHWSLDRAQSLLQYCADSSKLYMAVTGDSVLSKFEKVKDGLSRNLKRLEQIVPQHLAEQISSLLSELEQTVYVQDPLEEEAGKELIALINNRNAKKLDSFSELRAFYAVAFKLGIISRKAILTEKKALKNLIEKALERKDQKKKLLVSYLVHLLRSYSKIRKSNLENGLKAERRGSFPSCPSGSGSKASSSGMDSEGHASDIYAEVCEKEGEDCRMMNRDHPDLVPLPTPDEFRCPISLQLMADPVIISSGQTYERICIEKWFEEGYEICPKTQQKLEHLSVTPNYCVKGLIASWCERNGRTLPDPPSPVHLCISDHQWDLLPDLRVTKSINHQEGFSSPEIELERETVFANDRLPTELLEANDCDGGAVVDSLFTTLEEGLSCEDGHDLNSISGGESELDQKPNQPMVILGKLLIELKLASFKVQQRAAQEIRHLTKDNAEASSYIGDCGYIPHLVGFLHSAISVNDMQAQESALFTLLDVAIHNRRNKAQIVAAGAVALLLKILASESLLSAKEAAILIISTTSSVDENKDIIGSSGAMPYLAEHLDKGSNQGVKDALTALFNLSTLAGNCLCISNAAVISKLVCLLGLKDTEITEKCIAVLYNLASVEEGRTSIAETENCISVLAEILDIGSLKDREYVVGTFLLLCTNNIEYSELVLREGVIPSLVKLSMSGSPRGKDKANKLLQHFRQKRQNDLVFQESRAREEGGVERPRGSGFRSIFRKKYFGSSFGIFWRSKSVVVS